MYRFKFHALVMALAVFCAAGFTSQARSESPDKEASQSSGAESGAGSDAKLTRTPFNGTVESVDPSAKTLTLKGKERNRVIQITAQTRITRAGQTATLEQAIVGEAVGGLLMITADKKYEAVSIRLGSKEASTSKPKKKNRDKESGQTQP